MAKSDADIEKKNRHYSLSCYSGMWVSNDITDPRAWHASEAGHF